MSKYSNKSKQKLSECHLDLQLIYQNLIEIIDVTILEGKRSIERQEELVRTGMSKTMDSKHLEQEDGTSHAVDAAPCPIDWGDRERFIYMQGIIRGISHILYKNGDIEHKTRHGIDWDDDGNIKEHSFFDGPHVELKK